VRHVLHRFWVSPTLQCVLSSIGEPPALFVQVMKGERTMYSQPAADIGHAADIADDLRRTFVEDPQ
jgi:hypothetical protein